MSQVGSSSGYSGTPLASKLGFKPGMQVLIVNAPDDYLAWLSPLPEGVRFSRRISRRVAMVHLFATARADLRRQLSRYRDSMAPDAMIWVSWPKRASGVSTDVTEDTVRALALPIGLVDIKVCAVSAVWSGLKLVIRKELR